MGNLNLLPAKLIIWGGYVALGGYGGAWSGITPHCRNGSIVGALAGGSAALIGSVIWVEALLHRNKRRWGLLWSGLVGLAAHVCAFGAATIYAEMDGLETVIGIAVIGSLVAFVAGLLAGAASWIVLWACPTGDG